MEAGVGVGSRDIPVVGMRLCGYDAWARKGTVAGPEGVNGEGVA